MYDRELPQLSSSYTGSLSHPTLSYKGFFTLSLSQARHFLLSSSPPFFLPAPCLCSLEAELSAASTEHREATKLKN